MKNKSVTVYFKDGTNIVCDDGISWEYENDKDWLETKFTKMKNQFNWSMFVVTLCFAGIGIISNTDITDTTNSLILLVLIGVPISIFTGKFFT